MSQHVARYGQVLYIYIYIYTTPSITRKNNPAESCASSVGQAHKATCSVYKATYVRSTVMFVCMHESTDLKRLSLSISFIAVIARTPKMTMNEKAASLLQGATNTIIIDH